MKKKNILIIAGSLRSDGMGRANSELISHLAGQKNISLRVLAPVTPEDLPLPGVTIIPIPNLYIFQNTGFQKPQEAKFFRCEAERTYSFSLKNFIFPRLLPDFFIVRFPILSYIKILKKESITADLIHFATDYPNYLLGALVIKKPYIITAHGTYAIIGLTRGIRKYFIRCAYNRANRIHAVSKFTADAVREYIPQGKYTVINHGIDLATFSTNTYNTRAGIEDFRSEDCVSEFRHVLSLKDSTCRDGVPICRDTRVPQQENTQSPPTPPYFFSTGQVKPRKGVHISIEAFAKIANEFPGVQYLISGSLKQTDYVNKLQILIAQHNLEDRVHLLGHVSEDEQRSLFAHCLAYIQPSLTDGKRVFEGYGIVFLEAGAYRKPVLGTIGSGIEDAIEDGITGFLVPQNNPDAVAEKMREFLKNPERAYEMGKENFRKATEQSWENVIQKYVAIYESL